MDPFGLVGTTLEGRFVVDRVVAEGGFGVVYHAVQSALDRPVALKVLKTPKRFSAEEQREFLAGFAGEAKTVARITHPSIVQVFDFGVSEMPAGTRAAWMALEWLTGTTLEDDLTARRGGRGRTPAECLAMLRPILTALTLVHGKGVAHRDIKPANIMMVPSPVGTTLKLLDFGIAKIMDEDETPGSGHTRTRSKQIAFSPAYAAPEQISMGRSGPWTDVHAIALVLTELLIDGPAFDAGEIGVLYTQIVDARRPTPAKHGVDVGAWEAVLERALAVSTVARFRDAGELLAALESSVDRAYLSTRGAVTTIPQGSGTAPGSPRPEDTLAVMSTQLSDKALSSNARSGSTTGAPLFSDQPSAAAPPVTFRSSGRRSIGLVVVGAALCAATFAIVVATTSKSTRPAALVGSGTPPPIHQTLGAAPSIVSIPAVVSNDHAPGLDPAASATASAPSAPVPPSAAPAASNPAWAPPVRRSPRAHQDAGTAASKAIVIE